MSAPPRKPPPPPPPPGTRPRVHPRYELVAQLELRHGGDVVILPVGNISAGGVFLKAEGEPLPPLAVGDAVTVFLALEDGGEELALTMPAEVMRIDVAGGPRPPGVALMWTSADPAPVQTLARLLARVARPI